MASKVRTAEVRTSTSWSSMQTSEGSFYRAPLERLRQVGKWWSCSPGSTNLVRTLSFANPPTRSVGLRKPTRRVENHTPWLACKEPRQGIDGGAADTTSPVLTPKTMEKYDIPGRLALILHLITITVYKIYIYIFLKMHIKLECSWCHIWFPEVGVFTSTDLGTISSPSGVTPPNHLAKAIYKRMFIPIINCLASHENMTSTLIWSKSKWWNLNSTLISPCPVRLLELLHTKSPHADISQMQLFPISLRSVCGSTSLRTPDLSVHDHTSAWAWQRKPLSDSQVIWESKSADPG